MSEPKLETLVSEGKCLLELNGQFFGYDNDPLYPETFFDNPKDAYIFKSPKKAKKMYKDLSLVADERYKYRIVSPEEAKEVALDEPKGKTIYTIKSGGYTKRAYVNKKARDEKLEWYRLNRPNVQVQAGIMILEDDEDETL